MNKRNELRAKLQACHLQQQTRDGGAGGPSGNQIPKAKRPAAVAAISATVPKKQKVEQHKFHHHKQQHNLVHHHHQQQPIASSCAAATSPSSNALNSLEQRQKQQQQSLLLIREAAECAASAVDDAAGDVVVEECGGGGAGVGGLLASLSPNDVLRNRRTSASTATTAADSSGLRSGMEEDQQQAAPAASTADGAVPVVDAWLYSADGRQIDEGIAELSLDKAVHHLSVASADHSAEAIDGLITLVSQCVDLITDDQLRAVFPALRAHRLRGIGGAEKLLLLLIKRQKQRDGVDQQQEQQQFASLSSFTRPPPTKMMVTSAADGDDDRGGGGDAHHAIEQNSGATTDHLADAKRHADRHVDNADIILLMEHNMKKCPPRSSAADDYCQRLGSKSADELLELLLSTGTMDEQQQHFIVTELLAKRPDLFDIHASNFADQLHALFSSWLSIARSLVTLQLTHCASASLIKKSVSLLLNNFNPSLNPALVITFVAKVCAEDTKFSLMLSGEQCFVLALYVLEDIEQHYTPDMIETALNALDTVRLFCSVLAQMLRRQSESFSSALPSTASLRPGGPSSGVVPSSSSSSPDVLETFTHHYRAHMDKLRHANVSTSFFSPSGGGLMRRRHGLNMLYKTVCRHFPIVPSKCLFLGMFAPCGAQQTQRITRAKFDQLITGAIGEIFDLIIKVGKGGPEVELALDKAHQLVQHFRNCRDVQLSRYMPLLSTKVQQLVDGLVGRDPRNSPHCALLLPSLDLIIVALRNFGTDDDDDGADTQSLIQTATIALRSVLQLLQQNRRARQIQSLCERVCNGVIQLLKCNANFLSGAGTDGQQQQKRLHHHQCCDADTRRLFSAHGVLLGELSDWKALHVPDRTILKRTVMTIMDCGDSGGGGTN